MESLMMIGQSIEIFPLCIYEDPYPERDFLCLFYYDFKAELLNGIEIRHRDNLILDVKHRLLIYSDKLRSRGRTQYKGK